MKNDLFSSIINVKGIGPKIKKKLEEKNILGHVTSSYFSSNCKRSIAMALIKSGRARKGNKLVIPLLNGDKIKAKIVNPVFFDPNGVRKNGI